LFKIAHAIESLGESADIGDEGFDLAADNAEVDVFNQVVNDAEVMGDAKIGGIDEVGVEVAGIGDGADEVMGEVPGILDGLVDH